MEKIITSFTVGFIPESGILEVLECANAHYAVRRKDVYDLPKEDAIQWIGERVKELLRENPVIGNNDSEWCFQVAHRNPQAVGKIHVIHCTEL